MLDCVTVEQMFAQQLSVLLGTRILPIDLSPGLVTCFSQWNVSNKDLSRDLKCV